MEGRMKERKRNKRKKKWKNENGRFLFFSPFFLFLFLCLIQEWAVARPIELPTLIRVSRCFRLFSSRSASNSIAPFSKMQIIVEPPRQSIQSHPISAQQCLQDWRESEGHSVHSQHKKKWENSKTRKSQRDKRKKPGDFDGANEHGTHDHVSHNTKLLWAD